MQGPRIPAVERMGSVVACRTVGNGTEGGSRDQNPTAILMLDRVQLETGGIGKEGLNMARGTTHLGLTIEHFWHSMFWVHLSDQTCTEVAGEPISRQCRRAAACSPVSVATRSGFSPATGSHCGATIAS